MNNSTGASSKRRKVTAALIVVLVVVLAGAVWQHWGRRAVMAYRFRQLTRVDAMDPDAQPFICAVGAYGQEGVRYLMSKAWDGTDREKAAALAALAFLDVEDAVRPAAKALQSEDHALQYSAVLLLGQFDNPQSTDALKPALESDCPLIFTAGIVHFVRRSGFAVTGYDDALAGALERGDTAFRGRALVVLNDEVAFPSTAKTLGEQTANALRHILQDDPDLEHRILAAKILRNIEAREEPDAIPAGPESEHQISLEARVERIVRPKDIGWWDFLALACTVTDPLQSEYPEGHRIHLIVRRENGESNPTKLVGDQGFQADAVYRFVVSEELSPGWQDIRGDFEDERLGLLAGLEARRVNEAGTAK